MNSEIFIYALCDPDTKERRYIGKARNLEARVRSHRWEAQGSKLHTRKINWLRSLTRDPFVEILEICTEENWQKAERRWIAEARAQGLNLTNYADGGQTSPVEGKGHTEETKAKLRQVHLARGTKPPSRKGQPVSEQAKDKYRLAALRRECRPPVMGGWNKGMKSTHCPAGHARSPENTRICFKTSENRFYQSCRICMRLRKSERRLRRAA